MRRYESVVILDPDMVDDDIRTFTDRYSEVIKSYGGEVIKVDDWGIKRLAYLVKKRDKGRYILFDFAGESALIEELERQFKISEEVMKFLSVKLDSDVDLEAVKSAAEAKAAEARRAVEEAAARREEAATPKDEVPSPAAPPEIAAESKPEEETAQAEKPAEEATAQPDEEPVPATEEQASVAEESPASEPRKEVEQA